ncbi:MAG: recombination protein RecR [Verrucomicrobia bacterium]|nr:recombination protein RecR [Verrucomicrobiota bacterium]
MSRYPTELLALISHLKKLPGVGRKTAERFAFYLLEWPEDEIKKFANQLQTLKEKVYPCGNCGSLMEQAKCHFCDVQKRDGSILCLVSSPRDVYAIEETKVFKGVYHVIGALLSPLEGRSIERLNLEKLEKRLSEHPIQEVIIAFDSTLEGDATALFLKQRLDKLGIKATRLAFGLPMGSSLDFVDYGTLEKAFTGRHHF